MKEKPAMLDAIHTEIALRKDYLAINSIETLYFGGGTPSILTINELSKLIEVVQYNYRIVPDAEITIEVNPDDLTDTYLDGLLGLGFNRLSIGIQSFFDDDLQWMNRRHNGDEALRSIKKAQGKGFYNINIDLIYGLPNMTLQRWRKNLDIAFSLNIPHLSAYHLTIEPRTVFGIRRKKGVDYTIPEEDSLRQFDILIDTAAKAGLEHYEISNFARPGFYSKHNAAYWLQKPYTGIGPSAHSYDGRSRQWNINNNSQYIEKVNDRNGWFEREELSLADQYNDYVLTSLRTIWGTDGTHILNHFGNKFLDHFQRLSVSYIKNGLIETGGNRFFLNRPGKMLADRIISDLFWIDR